MSMIQYIKSVKQGFRDQHGFTPSGGTDDDPLFESIPDGDYPMTINGKTDNVKITGGTISCCNWDA